MGVDGTGVPRRGSVGWRIWYAACTRPRKCSPAAKALAEEIAANAAPVSASVSRGLLWRMLAETHPMAAHRADSAAIYDLGRKPDAREGVTAFLEKRRPNWTMARRPTCPTDTPGGRNPEY